MTTLAGFEFYGGATVTTIIDGSGAEWIACCARKLSTGVFGFYLFRNGAEVPYQPFCTGRGSINGGGRWIAAKDKEFFTGPIPGWVPYPPPAPGPAGPPGPQGPAGPAGDGALAPSDRTALDRLKAWLGIQD